MCREDEMVEFGGRGDRLMQYRRKHNLTQVEFAAVIGISSCYLSQMEACKRRISDGVICSIDDAFDGRFRGFLYGLDW